MSYSVHDRAEMVGVFRWMSVTAMETLARWVPTTPEMEVKVLFGRHVWDFAQHADGLGKRAFELRAPLHHTLPPTVAYQDWVGAVVACQSTADRIAAMYDAWCPAMAARYRQYLAHTDPLMDEPTVRLIERMLVDFQRMASERIRLTEALGLQSADFDVRKHLDLEAALVNIRPVRTASLTPQAGAVFT